MASTMIIYAQGVEKNSSSTGSGIEPVVSEMAIQSLNHYATWRPKVTAYQPHDGIELTRNHHKDLLSRSFYLSIIYYDILTSLKL